MSYNSSKQIQSPTGKLGYYIVAHRVFADHSIVMFPTCFEFNFVQLGS
jgi:hypothetical protein